MKNQKSEESVTLIPTELQKFEAFADRLTRRGFRIVPEKEKKDHQRVLNLIPPKGRKKRLGQIMLIFNHLSGLSVLVLTTFNKQTESLLPKGSAQAWVLITEKNKKKAPYISAPIRRTGRFWKKLLFTALISYVRVVNVPICKCGKYMSIARNRKAIGARFWKCEHKENHINEKQPTADWDIAIQLQHLEVIRKKRKARAKYRQKRVAKRLEPNYSRFHRKRWRNKTTKT